MTRINPEIKKLVDETFTTVTYNAHEKFLIYLAANFGWQHAIYRVKSILHDVDMQLSQMVNEQEYPDTDNEEGCNDE